MFKKELGSERDTIAHERGIVHKNVSLFYKEDKENNKIYLITYLSLLLIINH